MAVDPPWRILAVDDDAEVLGPLKEYLEAESVDEFGSKPAVETTTSFSDGLEMLEATRYDLLVLDVRIGEAEEGDPQAGVRTLERVRKRRFLPVIFNTAIPNAVEGLTSPLVRVVEKTQGLDALLAQVRELIATRLPEVNRVLLEHVEAIQRDYMWDFVGPNWEKFGATTDRSGLAQLLARRLALSLSGTGIEKLASRLGGAHAAASDGRVEPMRYYVLPPVELTPLVGDLYEGTIAGVSGHWILLTPSCDMTAPIRAEFVLLARCLPLDEQQEYERWTEKLPLPSRSVTGDMTNLLRNNRAKAQPDRYFFLPAAVTLPDLVVDFQQIESIAGGDLADLKPLASLDSPFAEALVARFVRYFGRVGTPDLNIDAVMARLRRDAGHTDEASGA
jgi:CheY-like chemotaxis protein